MVLTLRSFYKYIIVMYINLYITIFYFKKLKERSVNLKMNEILEATIHGKKIKYKILQELLNKCKPFKESASSEVSMFIDLNVIFNSLYKNNKLEFFNDIHPNDKYMIGSQIINIAAHYRHFFASRYKMYTNFYFIYSDKKPFISNETIPTYKEELTQNLSEKSIKYGTLNSKVVKKNVELIELLSKYIPNVYFINSQDIDTYIVPNHIINTVDQTSNFNIIYSNNKIMYNYITQYPNNLIILTPMSDKSKIISKDNLLKSLLTSKVREEYEVTINNSFFKDVLGVMKLGTYGLNGINKFGPLSVIKKLTKFIEENPDYPINKNIIKEEFIKNTNDKEYFEKTLDIFDIPIHYIKEVVSRDLELFLSDQLTDLIDIETLKSINATYLKFSPIDLEYIFEGEST